MRWYGYVARSAGMAKITLQDTVKDGRKRVSQNRRWEDDIKEWAKLSLADSQRAAHDRQKWKTIVQQAKNGAPTTPRVKGEKKKNI